MIDDVVNDSTLLQRITTGDETKVYGCNTETTIIPNEPRPKKKTNREQHVDLHLKSNIPYFPNLS